MKITKIFNHSWAFGADFLYSFIRDGESVFARQLRQALYGTSCYIDSSVVIANKKNFFCDEKSALYHGTYILNNFGRFTLGHHSHLGALCYVNVNYGRIEIGNNVAIGPHNSIIAYSNHYGEGKLVSDERIVGDICIGSNVFIGANCTILPNTKISDNVVVGAGSVVKGELASYGVYGGVPCKKIKAFDT